MSGYDEAELTRAAEAAIRAPSVHNSQPWRFRLRDGAIEVRLDPVRRLAVADHSDWGLSADGRPLRVRHAGPPDPAP